MSRLIPVLTICLRCAPSGSVIRVERGTVIRWQACAAHRWQQEST